MLTDAAVRNAKPKDKPYKLADSGGLYLQVTPSGSKLWRMKYRFVGKEKLLSFGQYPAVTLADARKLRDAAKRTLAECVDPAVQKRNVKRENALSSERSFEAVARDWFDKKKGSVSPRHAAKIWAQVAADLIPQIGVVPIDAIEPPEVLAAIRKIEHRGAIESSKRVLNYASQVFRYAIACGYVKRDPTQDIRGALVPKGATVHRAAINPADMQAFMRRLSEYRGHPATRLALEIVAHTFVRTSELRLAKWSEFEDLDGNAPLWRIPPARMKMRKPHLVPLSAPVVLLLQQVRELSGKSEYLFPARTKDGVMSATTLLYAMYSMGYRGRATVHGFRSTASTHLNEVGFHPDWIERQLAHTERDSVRAAYNAAEYLPQRRKMMEYWSAFLIGGQPSSDTQHHNKQVDNSTIS